MTDLSNVALEDLYNELDSRAQKGLQGLNVKDVDSIGVATVARYQSFLSDGKGLVPEIETALSVSFIAKTLFELASERRGFEEPATKLFSISIAQLEEVNRIIDLLSGKEKEDSLSSWFEQANKETE